MKKQINKNFMLSLPIVILLLLVVVMGLALVLRDVPDEERAFWYLFFGMGFFMQVVIWAFMIILPAILAVGIFIFSLIARLIYKDTPGRIRAYRILMGFSFAGQGLVLWGALSLLSAEGWSVIIIIAINAYIIWALVSGMRGTYTERIKAE